MLVKDYSNEDCKEPAAYYGDCCCNCKFRLLSITDDGFPLGYYCGCPIFTDRVMFIGFDGHGICECHMRENHNDGI